VLLGADAGLVAVDAGDDSVEKEIDRKAGWGSEVG